MQRKSKLAILATLSLSLSLNFADASLACGPDYPKAVLFSWNHPDMPLKSFAGGNIGVAIDTWAKSYLCVAYRYFDGKPLNSTEQISVDHMWNSRLQSEATYIFDDDYFPASSYYDLREKVLHVKSAPDFYKIQTTNFLTDSAFRFALKTLRTLIKNYGQSSPTVKQWVLAQDCVFGVNKQFKITVPQKLPANVDRKLSVYRDYQIAAATYYLREFEAAEKQFAKLASVKVVPEIQKMAAYLEVRAAEQSMMGASYVPHDALANLKRLRQFEKRASDVNSKLDIVDLESLQLSQNLDPDENIKRIVESILRSGNDSGLSLGDLGLGRDIWDLTYLMEGNDTLAPFNKTQLNKYDLLDWIDTVSNGTYDFYEFAYPSDEQAKAMAVKQEKRKEHALARWRERRSKPWLVAVMMCGGLRGDDVSDVRAAAEQLKPGDSAYLTASFYLIDNLIQKRQFAEARAKLQGLNYSTMPVTSVNLFKAQQIATSENIDKLFASACMPVSASASNLLLVDDAKWRNWGLSRKPLMTFDNEVGRDLDRFLPWQRWVDFSNKSDLTPNLKQRILCAVWIKARFLGKSIDENALLERLKPFLSKATVAKVSRYQQTNSLTEKQFLFAQIILDNYGMSPYVKAGLPRFADKIDTFNYYQQNFWQPLVAHLTAEEIKKDEDDYRDLSVVERINQPISRLLRQYYSTQKVDALLSSSEVKNASSELATMEKQHPSKVLGTAVLNYAKTHPGDPDVPQYLYKIVKLPRWSGETDTGSEYSRMAYVALHKNYPTNKWTKQAVCWY